MRTKKGDTERGQLSRAVRELAGEYDVCERTVWRWFARAREEESYDLLTRARTCEACGTPLPDDVTIRRRFCDVSCRVWAYRQELKHEAEAG